MMIKSFLICHDKYSYLQKKIFSFGYFWCGAKYLLASYIATEKIVSCYGNTC